MHSTGNGIRIDIAELLDSGAWTTYQKLLTALTALAIIFDGFDLQILGFVIPSLIKEWHVSRASLAPVLALGLAGMVVGSPLAGYIGDRFGRRTALIACIALFGVATVATAWCHSVPVLAILRFVTGMGVGGALPNASALVAEFSPANRRPTAVKFTIICVPLGGMLGGLIASRVLPVLGWRALYLIGGSAPLVFTLILLMLLAESPRFMAQRPACWDALSRFLKRAGHTVAPNATFWDSSEMANGKPALLATLFNATHWRDTTGIWMDFFFCLAAIYLIFGWLPALLANQGMSVAAASDGLTLYNFGGVIGMLIWTVLLTKFGSRIPMLAGCLAASVTALAIVFVNPSLLLPVIALQGLFANALQTSSYALATNVYPTSVRATGVAYASAIGRVGGLISSFFGAAIIGQGATVYWGFVAATMLCACAGIAMVRNHFQSLGAQPAAAKDNLLAFDSRRLG